MRIRTQLALSFLVFTVIPLAGLTLYSYYTSIRAFRQVVQEESAALAEEMSHRMEDVTLDLRRRIDRLDRRPFYNLRVRGKDKPPTRPADLYAQILASMGDMASYVDSLEFPVVPPPGSPAHRYPPLPSPPPPMPRSEGRPSAPGGAVPGPPDLTEGARPAVENPPAVSSDGTGEPKSVVVHMEDLNVPAVADPAAFVAWIEQEKNRIILKHAAVALRELDKLKVPDVGIKVSAGPQAAGQTRRQVEDAVRKAAEAQKAHEKLADEARRQIETTRPRERRLWADRVPRSKMEILVSRDDKARSEATGPGGPIRAQVRADEILRRIFEQGRSTHGEIQFAVDKEGQIHTPTPDHVDLLRRIGLRQRDNQVFDPTACPDDCTVATVKEPLSGMTFGIARPIGASLREMRLTALRNLGIGFGFIGLALLGIIPLSGRMTRDLSTLTKGVEKLSGGDRDVRVPVRSRDEFGALAQAFNQMAADLADQQERLVEQERIQKELEMCRRIQEVLLPREPLRVGFAEAKGLSIPARQVGGDFFNYFLLPEGDVAVLMGDVSGKGVPAALLMANLQARLQAKLQVERDLARLAQEVDREISQHTESHTFATLFMGIVSRDGRSLRWVSAGHNPQFILDVDGRLQALPSSGRPVGLLPGESFTEHQVELHHGDFLFLYTDGLVEAANPAGQEFGTERLESVLIQQRGRGLDQIMVAIVEALDRHRAGAEARDDTALLALRIA